MPPAPRRSLALVATLLLALGAAVRAGVDVAVGNGDKVTGTLLPADEVETYRVNVPEGAVFKLKVKGLARAKGQPKPPVRLTLRDPDGALVGSGNVVLKPTAAQLKGYPAAKTGTYRIEVSGDGATSGDYQLIVKWSSPRKLRFDLADSGPGEPSEVSLPVDAGAVANITLKAVKGSPATPVASRLEGPSTFAADLDPPAAGATSHKIKKVTLPEFGDTTLFASGGGAYTCSVSIAPPKVAKRSIDLSQATIGGDPTGARDLAFGAIIGPEGGSVSVGSGQSELIGGSSVFVPAGAMSSPAPILIGTSSPLPPGSPDEQAAGPTVFFGPEGLTFTEGTPVQVTIPFDAETFGGSLDDLRVFTRDADGNVTEITDFTVDVVAGTCTFPASHFSSFRVFAPRLPAPVEGDVAVDGTGDLVLRAPDNGAGRVYVVPGGPGLGQVGSTADAPIVLTGESTGGRFGEVVAVGDVNEDGREDLVVTAPFAGVNGRVYVFFGRPDLASTGAAAADVILSGQARDLGFGIRIAVGDVNGDGVDDVVVGAESSSVGVTSAGAAYVFFGSRELFSRNAEHADVILTGSRTGERFGASVAIGDVTGDGLPDVLVGADETVRTGQTLSSIGPGRVLVFAGGPDLRALRSSKADFVLVGRERFSTFGLEVAVGNVDGDSADDVIVAAAKDDGPGEDAGVVFVYRGGRLGDPPVQLTGEAPFDELGFQIASRDLNGDGRAEVVASSIARSSERGAVYVFAGAPVFPAQVAGDADSILTGESTGHRLGILQHPWDVTGDGVPDLLVYAPRAAAGAGRAYVHPGGPSLPASGSVGSAPISVDGQAGDQLGGNP